MDRRCRAVGVGDAFLNEVPAVIEERHRRFLRHFLHAAGLRVAEVRYDQHAIRGSCLQAVGGIVSVCPISALRHVAVKVVYELGVLVETVRRPVGGISDLVIAISRGNT